MRSDLSARGNYWQSLHLFLICRVAASFNNPFNPIGAKTRLRVNGTLGLNMSTFSTDGFLSDEISSWEDDFEKQYSSKLELSIAVNRLAHEMVFTIDIRSEDLRDLLLSTLLARQLSTFQGFVILSRKGMIFQAEMLVRALAESMFLVGAICKKPDFAKPPLSE